MATGVDAKLLKSTKFPPEFNQKVDMQKVNIQVMKKWIAGTVTKILGNEDDVVIELIFNLIEASRYPDIKSIQLQLTGFLEKDTPTFCKDLWKLLISAQDSPQGVPKELLEAKKQELLQEKIEADKAAEEARLRREELERRDRDRDRPRGGRGGGGGGRGGDSWRGRRDDRDRGGMGRGGHRSRSPPRYRDQRDRGDRGPRGGMRDTYVPRGSPTFRRGGGGGGGRRDDRRRRSPSVLSTSSRSPSRSPSDRSRASSYRSPSPPRRRGARPRSRTPPTHRESQKRRRSPRRSPERRGRSPTRSRSISSDRDAPTPKRRRYSSSPGRSRSRSVSRSRKQRYSRSRSTSASRSSRYSRSPSRTPPRRSRRSSRSRSASPRRDKRRRRSRSHSMTRSRSPVRGGRRSSRSRSRSPRRRARARNNGDRSRSPRGRRGSIASSISSARSMADRSGAEDRPRSSHKALTTGDAELNKTKLANEQREKELKEQIKKMRFSHKNSGETED